MVAFSTPVIRVHHFQLVDDPAAAGPDTRPEADRLADLIAAFERHLESKSMVGLARQNFQEAVNAMKFRLAELRRLEQGPEHAAPADTPKLPS